MGSLEQKSLQQLPGLPGTESTEASLQRFLLFAIAVAGKTAKQIDKALDLFLTAGPTHATPFEKVEWMIQWGVLRRYIRRSSLGQHHKLNKAYRQVIKRYQRGQLNLRNCRPAELETIYGIGPKTSRFFVLHSRAGERYAVLDTHILKWLGSRGLAVPKSTPSGRRYRELEQHFLKLADDFKVSPAELDATIWASYARGGGTN